MKTITQELNKIFEEYLPMRQLMTAKHLLSVLIDELRENKNIHPKYIAKGFNPLKLTKSQVGEGYRLLKENEKIRKGDQFWDGNDLWRETTEQNGWIGRKPATNHIIAWRRKTTN